MFHFGHPLKYTDHEIDEFSKHIKSLIYPKDQRGRYPYDYRQHTPQIYFDDYSKHYNDEHFSRDKLEKPPSKGPIGSSEGANLPKNNDKYSKNDNEKYDNSDKSDISSEEDSKYDIKNKGKEWYDKKDKEEEASKEEVGKDDIKKVSNEGFDKHDEVGIDNGKGKSDEKTGIPENEPEVNSKSSHEIEISPPPLSLTDNDNSKVNPIDQIYSDFSIDQTYNENANNNPLPIKIEENVKPLQNLPESLQPNLLDNKAINIASSNELPSSNHESVGFNSIVSNANSDATIDLNNIPSVTAFENQISGALYNNGFSNNNYSPYNNVPPYLYDSLGFAIPNINTPSNFAPNNFFYFPSNTEFYRYPNFNQQQYQPVQLNNGQIVLIPNYWPIYQPINPYLQNVGSGQVYQPNNQMYPGQIIPSIQNFNDVLGSINRQSIVPGIPNVPRWLWYSNQNTPFNNGQNNIEGKGDNKPKFPINLKGVNPRTNAPLSLSKDGIKDGEIKEDN